MTLLDAERIGILVARSCPYPAAVRLAVVKHGPAWRATLAGLQLLHSSSAWRVFLSEKFAVCPSAQRPAMSLPWRVRRAQFARVARFPGPCRSLL
jgi:hypothetical protein